MAILLMLYSSSICALICGIPGYCYNIYDRSSNDKYDLNMHIAKVESLPTIRYDTDLHKAIHFCVVCMSEFKNNEVLTYLPCDPRHFFHSKCIKSWLITNQTCPICKEEVQYTKALEQHQQNNYEQMLMETEGNSLMYVRGTSASMPIIKRF